MFDKKKIKPCYVRSLIFVFKLLWSPQLRWIVWFLHPIYLFLWKLLNLAKKMWVAWNFSSQHVYFSSLECWWSLLWFNCPWYALIWPVIVWFRDSQSKCSKDLGNWTLNLHNSLLICVMGVQQIWCHFGFCSSMFSLESCYCSV